MKRKHQDYQPPCFTRCLLATLILAVTASFCRADDDLSAGDKLVAKYFRQQTKLLTNRTFQHIDSLQDWTEKRDHYRQQLFEMLGMDPMPEKTPLEAVVTGTVEADDIIVENIHFQSMPGLYVTANFYRPKKQSGPLPAILYVCGHGRVKKDGISYGNKTHYQHHGAWFARNGYVCLTIDTIQLGEIEGIHHGTYREKMWWWNNRGYSSAGAEAWNCIRSLDYLQSREEVDPDRIGVTGRSGGGAYSWWTAAIDERVKVAVPVAGITSLHNHVVDGCVQGHCDCMYMVNTYRWDYPMVAALVAPRPLLISNTDKDRIFPLDGVVDVHKKVRKIYQLYEADDKLGLHITEGPHKDTQELRIHAFRWFNRFLKNDDALIESTATKFFEPEQLKVFDELPEDQRVTDIHESFVPAIPRDRLPGSREQFLQQRDKWMKQLSKATFGGWPQDDELEKLDVSESAKVTRDGVTVRVFTYTSQSPYRLNLYVAEANKTDDGVIQFQVLNERSAEAFRRGLATALPDLFGKAIQPDDGQWSSIAEQVKAASGSTHVFCETRGHWSKDERVRTHIRRRFMQLGQTADGMKIWDLRRALQALDSIAEFAGRDRVVDAEGNGAARALYASLYEDRIAELRLKDLPTSNRQGITLLNVSRFVEMPHVLLMASDRVQRVGLGVSADTADTWEGAVKTADNVFPKPGRIEISTASDSK